MENAKHITLKTTWRGSLDYGWATMIRQFLRLLIVVFILALIDLPVALFSDEPDRDFHTFDLYADVMGLAYIFLFAPVIAYGADLLFIQAVRGEQVRLRNIIAGFNNFVNVVLAHLLVIALVGIGIIVFIVPGIIVACRLAFVSYLVMDKGMDALSAVEKSWQMTRGYGWTIFSLGLTAVLVFMVGILFVFVGVFPAILWMKASFASLYQAALEEKGAALFPETTANPA